MSEEGYKKCYWCAKATIGRYTFCKIQREFKNDNDSCKEWEKKK